MLHNKKELWVVCSSPYVWNTYVVFEILDCIHYYSGKSKNECNTNKTLILGNVRGKQYPQHGIWSGTQIHVLHLFTNKIFYFSFLSWPNLKSVVVQPLAKSWYQSLSHGSSRAEPQHIPQHFMLGSVGSRVVISPQKHSALGVIEISESTFVFWSCYFKKI